MADKQGTPPWIWIGCGCMLCLALLVGGIVGVGVLGVGFFKGMVDDMADPEARRANVLSTLGAEELPEGYVARISFSFPFVFDLVMLDDGEPPQELTGESFEEKAQSMEDMIVRPDRFDRFVFIYLSARGSDERSIEQVLSGERRASGTNVDLGLEFRDVEALDRGTLEIHGAEVSWRTARGTLETVGGTFPAAWAAVSYGCDDERKREGLWVEKLDAAGAAPSRVADPAELALFLQHFDVCR